MTDKSKENSKQTAIQIAMLAGFHLDPNEALALLKSGFFSTEKNNEQQPQVQNQQLPKIK